MGNIEYAPRQNPDGHDNQTNNSSGFSNPFEQQLPKPSNSEGLNLDANFSSCDVLNQIPPTGYEVLLYAPVKKGHPVGIPGAIIDEKRRETIQYAREKGYIDKLPDNQRVIIEQRYSTEGTPRTLEKIGSNLGVTRENIRQREASAFRNLQRLKEGKDVLKTGRPHKDVDVSEVIRLYTVEKKPQTEVASLMACNQSLISKLLEKAGVPTRTATGRKKIEININLLVWQYIAEEMSAKKIAGSLGVSENVVLDRLRKAGYPIRPASRRKETFDLNKAVRLFVSGNKTVGEIADQLNSSSYIVSNRLKQAGYRIKPGRRPRKS